MFRYLTSFLAFSLILPFSFAKGIENTKKTNFNEISVLAPIDDCNLNGLRTFTQGGWGSPGNSTPGGIRDAYFNIVFPNGLSIGDYYKIKFFNASAIEDYLPAGGTPRALITNYNDPVLTSSGILGGQITALALNIYFDDAGYLNLVPNSTTKLKDLVIVSGPFAGMTVMEFFNLAQSALGGAITGFSYSQINDAATAINENFDNGTVDDGYLECPPVIPCLTNWTGTLGDDILLCETAPQQITVDGSVTITPSYSKGTIKTSWEVVGSNDIHYNTINITGNTNFTITAQWPGVTQGQTEVRIRFTLKVLDCNGIEVGTPVVKYVYWTSEDCTEPPPDEQADLRLQKTVSNPNAQNGDEVTYTITVTNDGPNSTTGVKVKDVLPEGLEFISATPSVGTYDLATGIWDVGTLASGASATLLITVSVNADLVVNTPFDLGPAQDFNVFVLYDINQPSADTEGRMAVGRNASLSNYSVGDKLPDSHGTVDVLIVGENLTFTSGRVYSGNVVYGNSTNLPIYAVTIDGYLRQDNPIDFDAARTYLRNLSIELSNRPVNGTTTFQWGEVKLVGTDPYLNVFSVLGSNLSLANNLSIQVPNGSIVLVNIDGTTVSWMGGLTLTGTDKSNVLFNFYQAEEINMYGIDVRGSILAPLATLNFAAGVVNGQVIAKNITGSGQYNNTHFRGNIPQEEIIVNVAEVFASALYDPDSTPNNGISTEDDYASVNLNVNSDNGGGDDNWEIVGNFNFGEYILTLANDNTNNILAGTLGGKIYRSTDNCLTWTRINPNMYVGFIWDLAVNSTGDIFAATEQGLFKSVDNGNTWTLTTLAGKDVRAIQFDNNILYAGTWGFGIFKSLDNGLTFNAINNGLSALAIHALVFDSNHILYAGTVGSGVVKSTNLGESWTDLNVGYNFIWALGITSDNKLFAGTYGDGVYRSINNGVSWTKLNSLPAPFVYNIVVDALNNIFVGSWSGGIYASSNNGDTWTNLGVPGAKISSMLINPNSTNILVGSEDGYIYKKNGLLTSVKEDNQIPKEFALSQNYPNPFNPATVINYSIPQAGRYTIKVYNTLGQEVAVLLNGDISEGNYLIKFNGENLSSGMYIYQLKGENISINKKMLLLK
ncbi:MAG TPA: collagen-binding domain-containing protein [Ignavibacteriaceae bacterium]|nr:collagen-binding domain-containing protein [Ignavibacteriaceae bacterium]